MNVKQGDWVRAIRSERIGFVRRVAKDGSWADVDWGGWSKRMRTSDLIVQHTIPLGDGITVTDVARKKELEEGDEEGR